MKINDLIVILIIYSKCNYWINLIKTIYIIPVYSNKFCMHYNINKQ